VTGVTGQSDQSDKSEAPAGSDRVPSPGEPDRHPVNALDDVVHQRVRLGVLTVAHQARRVEFGFLRTTLELTAGNLSQHLAVLEKAGLIEVDKGYEGRRPRTWITLTPAGDKALQDEVAQLRRLIHQIDQANPDV
jgi:DNA-binding MarR family transcriptional regulator